MTNKTIAQGAEAIITLGSSSGGGGGLRAGEAVVTKNRIKKSYRIPIIDERIRKSRTKAEAKIINKLSKVIPVPKMLASEDKQEIIMEFIDGKKLSENLESLDY